MAYWGETIDVAYFFQAEDLSFEEKKKGIVERLASSEWYEKGSLLKRLVGRLDKTTNIEEFDCVFNQIYDAADIERVWIATF